MKKAKSQNVGSLSRFNISSPKLETQRIQKKEEFFIKRTIEEKTRKQAPRCTSWKADNLTSQRIGKALLKLSTHRKSNFSFVFYPWIVSTCLRNIYNDLLLFPCSSVVWVGSDGFSYFWWIILINCYWQLHWKTIAICFPFLTFFNIFFFLAVQRQKHIKDTQKACILSREVVK